MDIATGAMGTVLQKLGKLLVGEYKLQKSVKSEINELVKELEVMNAALRMVSEVPSDQLHELPKIWARDVRDLSYDIEDAVDAFMISKGCRHTRPSTFTGFLDRIANLFNKVKTNHQSHNVFKDIMDEVKKATERRERYKIDAIAARPNMMTFDPRLEAMYRKATELVGINKPKDELAKQLLEQVDCFSRQQPKIISIVGFGGLGKTTLANILLQDHKAKFDCHVFVSVSLKPDISMILNNILSQLDKHNKNEAWHEMQLINKIREPLENKRCLCIIDDVWKELAWDTIKLALQDAKHGSKIIITTRNKAIAEHAGGAIYELKPLSDDDSRKLLNKRIFDFEGGCPPSLSEVAGKILKKCGGVPLAIITIASLLASRPKHLLEWEKVNNSIGTGLGDSLDVGKMRKIIGLSYNDLPFHLKTCLLSLSKYPEDTVIRKDVLVWSWMEEGFIKEETQSAGRSLQVIGDSYFIELINRSLIQPVDGIGIGDEDEQVHACKVHDMVLELINQLSAEEGFVTMLSSDDQQAGTSAAQKKIRRLSLRSSNKFYASSEASEQLSKVRSLTVFGRIDSILPLSSFHVLRVLQLEDCTGLDNNHLNGLGHLRHLRFLRLGFYSATELPESIGKLESLETLDIRGTWYEVLLLPPSFVKLRKLVRLYADRVRLPDGLALGDMQSLRELVGVYFTPEVIKEIGNLKDLRVLRIFFKYGTSYFEESITMCLQRLTNLQDMELEAEVKSSCSLDSMQHVPSGLQRFMIDRFYSEAFPRWINSSILPCLTSLSIMMVQDTLLPHHLERLAELPSLSFLKLSLLDDSKLQQKIPIHSGAHAFQCLRYFHCSSPSMIFRFQPGAMPELQKLYLWFYYDHEKNKLNEFGLENLNSLRHVIIECIDVIPGNRQVEATIRKAFNNDIPNHPWVEFTQS